jgi:Spy/CpxP family protein refolding chaperone
MRMRILAGLVMTSLVLAAIGEVTAQGRQGGQGRRGGAGQRDGGGRQGGGRQGGFGQRGPGGGGFGGGFMGGGFGGGFMGGGGLLGLLRVDAVRKEIETVPDQDAQIQKLVEELRPPRPDFPENFREMTEEERRPYVEKMQAERAKRAKQEREKLTEILLPPQMDRLLEISVQQQGLGALRDPEIAAKLNITEEQQQKMRALTEESMATMQREGEAIRERMRAAFQEGGGDREEMRRQMEEVGRRREEMAKQMEEKIMAVLSADQKASFAKMKGEPFEMPRPDFRGQGRRGGEGGDRGGNRRQRPAPDA